MEICIGILSVECEVFSNDERKRMKGSKRAATHKIPLLTLEFGFVEGSIFNQIPFLKALSWYCDSFP